MSVQRLAADDFAGIAAQQGLRAPPVVTGDGDAWDAHCRKVWRAFPAYGFDRCYVAELAAEVLPRVLAQMGVGRSFGMFRGGPWRIFSLAPDDPAFLAVNEWHHNWRCPSLAQRGPDLVSLGAWRWGISEGKAAFRIARICGRARPVP